MYKLLPSLTKCCFCVPLEPGLLVWAYVKLAINITLLQYYLSRLLFLVEYGNHTTLGLVYSIFGTALTILIFCLFLLYYILNLIFNLIHIVGAHKKNTALLMIFFWYAVGYAVLFFIIGGVYFILNLIFNLIQIVGAHKKNTALLMIFFWYAVGHAVLFFIIGGVLAFCVPVIGPLDLIILALIWITYCTSLVFYIYEIFLVSSVISKLKLATNDQVHNHWDHSE